MTKPYAQAFTLVETLVAITVLIVAIVGPLYAVHKAVTASFTARDALIANALAQEGMEYVRSVRDGNYLSGASDWMNGLGLCFAATGCAVEPGASPQACASSGCSALRLDASYRYRQNTTGTLTRFSRKVTITNVSATEIVVTTAVSWSTLRIPYTVTVSEHLYNWQ